MLFISPTWNDFSICTFLAFPAPILFGLVIDTTCMVLRSPCARGRPGACALYNSETLRFRLHGFVLVTKGVAFLLYSLALFVSRKASFSVEDNKSLQAAEKDADINHNKETELKLMGKTDSSEMAANSWESHVIYVDSVFPLHRWASYQIRKIGGCAFAGNAGKRFIPSPTSKKTAG